MLHPNYLNEVAEIDSISLANSQSAAKKTLTSAVVEPKLEFKKQRKKVKMHKHLKSAKQIPECDSDSHESMALTFPTFPTTKQETSKKTNKGKKGTNSKSRNKSKSMKSIRPKSREPTSRPLRVVVTERIIPE